MSIHKKQESRYKVRGTSPINSGKNNLFSPFKMEAFSSDPQVGDIGDISGSRFDNFFHPSYSPDLFSLPYTLKDERDLFQWFYERDPYVGHAIDLLTELPISKVRHSLPITSDSEKAHSILNYIKMTSDKINLFDLLMNIAHEYWLYGNVFVYVEKNSRGDSIERTLILDPNLIQIEKSHFSIEPVIFLVPDQHLKDLIHSSFIDNDVRKLLSSIPDEIQKAIYDNKKIEINTNPFEGTFVHHIHRRKSQYDVLGQPILRRCLNDLMYRERLRQAQVMVAMRNMAPKHLVTTEAPLEEAEIDNLRDQIDASMETPDYVILTTFQLNWEQVGAENRILQLTSEWEEVNTRIAAGMGLKKEMIFGDGVFGDIKLGLDVLDKRFSLFRSKLQDFIERALWAPLCLKKGFVEKTEYSNVVLTPGLSFTRLTLRDNDTVFQNLYQLYTKGSISIRTILDLFNIDPDQELEYLHSDLFTLNDSKFNDMLSSLYQQIGTNFGDDPRFKKLIAERGLGIKEYEALPVNAMASSLMTKKLSSNSSDSIKIPSDKSIILGQKDRLELKPIQDLMLANLVNKVNNRSKSEKSSIII